MMNLRVGWSLQVHEISQSTKQTYIKENQDRKDLKTRSRKQNKEIMGFLEGEKGTNGEKMKLQQIIENFT